MNWPARDVSPVSALVVEPDEADRMFVVAALTSVGVQVIATDNFTSARACLEAQAPLLLVTEIQLGAYNGLHLALLGRFMSPRMSLVVTSRCRDLVLQRFGEEFGAVFVQKPLTEGELFAALVLATPPEPIVTRAGAPIRPPHDARHHEHREIAGATPGVRARRGKRRRRDIASFLLLEALRR